MDKRELILDALQELLDQGKAGTASVSDIARQANIAKGGMYYYFKSKEEVFDALAERQYSDAIAHCTAAVSESNDDAITKLKVLLHTYRNTTVNASIDEHLHRQENAAIHQKSMASILNQLTPLVAGIIAQGNEEGFFTCEHPKEAAEIMLSVLVFLLDPGLFELSQEARLLKLETLASFMESGLRANEGSFAFLYETWQPQKRSPK